MPQDLGIIDLMVGVPDGNSQDWYRKYDRLLRDEPSRGSFSDAVGYLFKDIPNVGVGVSYPSLVLAQMDRYGIARAMIPIRLRPDDIGLLAVRAHPDRFFGSFHIDPNQGMAGLRALEMAVRDGGARAATAFPCGYDPQVPINDKRMFPFYAKCIELDIPMCINAGVPGPRLPLAPQKVELLDEVCWFFPELRLVTRHGCEPWTALAIKLMLKYPNLYYSTSAFAPKHYPKDIIEFANTRGADKILYAGYFPSGLSFERSFAELPAVPFRDAVWPKFLRENAERVFGLAQA
jgi:predicted TIM-barrel fold metal-dependent hydrolase